MVIVNDKELDFLWKLYTELQRKEFKTSDTEERKKINIQIDELRDKIDKRRLELRKQLGE